ncbi:MAG TPA: enoyl-CoA hydratase/isomerase family protein [Pseudonocardiaceae bacterium]|nr:enoyl-CoA hydratase/isomerase family protein [Pseudonocardiaceae bacterium]
MTEHRVGEVCVRAEGHVVHALIDRPSVRNAINDDVIDGLTAAIDLAEQRQARVLVVRGSGGTFCAGADLVMLERIRQDTGRVEKFMARLGAVLDRIENAPFASIAVVEGYAVAGGCELLLACDVVVATATARIGDRHVEYGLVPAAGGSVRLSRQLPKARANYLLLSGELLSGADAARWGLATVAVPAEHIDNAAAGIVSRISGRSTAALATVKDMLGNAGGLPQSAALDRERALFMEHIASSDCRSGLAAFRDRRAPSFN